MLVLEPEMLAEALRRLMKDRVIIRYAASNYRALLLDAELSILTWWGGREYLARLVATVHVGRSVKVGVRLEITDLDEKRCGLEDMCAEWWQRSFDDWCHDSEFIGALEILREGRPHTSVKLDPSDNQWAMLTGILIGELDKLEATAPADNDHVIPQVVSLMKGRFSAFAAQAEHASKRLNFR